jgi:short-subunit dehydrogenase
MPVPLRSAYSSAKAAQIAFFGTLANELAAAEHGTAPSVHVVIPGFVRTEVSRNALTADGAPSSVMDPNQAGGISAERAACDIIQGVVRGQRRIYTGYPLRLSVARVLARIAPGVLDRILARAEVR